MNVTREVILDLLPLYVAGEASPDTRALVESYLEQDPELAREVREQRAGFGAPATIEPPPEAELETLKRTRSRLAQLRWLFGLAMAFTSMSLATGISFSGGGISRVRLLLFDYPQVLAPLLAIGLACWAGYFTLRRRLGR